jgi:hypothetical protein
MLMRRLPISFFLVILVSSLCAGQGLETPAKKISLPSVPAERRRPSDLTLHVAVRNEQDVRFFNSFARPTDSAGFFQRALEAGLLKELLPKITKGFKLYNVASIQYAKEKEKEWAGKVQCLSYDHEKWEKTPYAEQTDPGEAAKQGAALAHAHGALFMASPSYQVSKRHAEAMAKHSDIFLIHCQGMLRDDPKQYVQYARELSARVRKANPPVKVWLFLSARAEPEEMYEMTSKVCDCIDGLAIDAGKAGMRDLEPFLKLLRPH